MATCKDCIHDEVCNIHGYIDADECACFKNKSDYAEVKHGEWQVHQSGDYWHYDCPFCDDGFATQGKCKTPPNYCGNCGADMRGRRDIHNG